MNLGCVSVELGCGAVIIFTDSSIGTFRNWSLRIVTFWISLLFSVCSANCNLLRRPLLWLRPKWSSSRAWDSELICGSRFYSMCMSCYMVEFRDGLMYGSLLSIHVWFRSMLQSCLIQLILMWFVCYLVRFRVSLVYGSLRELCGCCVLIMWTCMCAE